MGDSVFFVCVFSLHKGINLPAVLLQKGGEAFQSRQQLSLSPMIYKKDFFNFSHKKIAFLLGTKQIADVDPFHCHGNFNGVLRQFFLDLRPIKRLCQKRKRHCIIVHSKISRKTVSRMIFPFFHRDFCILPQCKLMGVQQGVLLEIGKVVEV